MEEIFVFLTEYTEFLEKMEVTQQEKLDLLQRLYGVRTALLQTESGPLVVPLMKGREGGAEDG